MPNYIAPVIYYAPTYDSYDYGGGYDYDRGTSYSGGYGYSSGGGYSNSSGSYYPTYIPQSAYYTKEAQLVAEENITYKTTEKRSSSVENVDDGYEYIQNGKLYVNWGAIDTKILGGLSVSLASMGFAAAGMKFDDDNWPITPKNGTSPDWGGIRRGTRRFWRI